jgi:hypothetical protein
MSVLVVGGGNPDPQIVVLREDLDLDDPRIGVVYDTTVNQAAKVQAALDMAANSGGGTVLVGGRVRMGNTSLSWPQSGAGKGAVWLRGVGVGAEYSESPAALWWDSDTSSATPLPGDHANTQFGIRTSTNTLAWRVSDICLQGPGDVVPIGSMPCKMYGFFSANRGSMENVNMSRWGAAVGIINDHQNYADCDFGGNGYGVDFMDNFGGGLGDMLFRRINLSGQYRASIALSASNCIANARFLGNGHCGAAPYGI